MLAIASAASSSDFTSTPRRSAHRSTLVVEQVPRQAVHLADESALVKRLGVHVVGRQVVAARHDRGRRDRDPRASCDAATRCPPSRATYGSSSSSQCTSSSAHGRSTGIASTGLAVTREPALLDDAARLEQLHRLAVAQPVERHRQVELVGAHAERRRTSCATRSLSPASWNSGAVGRSARTGCRGRSG